MRCRGALYLNHTIYFELKYWSFKADKHYLPFGPVYKRFCFWRAVLRGSAVPQQTRKPPRVWYFEVWNFLQNFPPKNNKITWFYTIYYLLFTILHPFGTRESIRQKVDHGGQIVLCYWPHATNLVRAIVFVVCMSSLRVLVWMRGRVEQKRSLTFYVFG